MLHRRGWLHLCEHDSTVWVHFCLIGVFDVVVDLCVEFLYMWVKG